MNMQEKTPDVDSITGLYDSKKAYSSIIAMQKHASNNEFILNNLFSQDDNRLQNFSIHSTNAGMHFDFSKNLIDHATMDIFAKCLKDANIQQYINDMLCGKCINQSEQRPVLHVALRSFHPLIPKNVVNEVNLSLAKMVDFCHVMRANNNITDIIHIGIGGSDLGPKMVYHALEHTYKSKFKVHFLNNIDGAQLEHILDRLEAKNTLIISCSKTFTTLETCANLDACIAWLNLYNISISKHVVAITANVEQAKKYDIEQIFSFEQWVGGRFSLWSSVGLVIMLCYGEQVFKELLAGAAHVDKEFINNDFKQNIPQILAMLGIWYRNVFNLQQYCVSAYAENLHGFTAYLQQLDMESNGKSVGMDNRLLPYHTAPIVFGEVGTHCQHAYFQLLHQGTQSIPVDFITYKHAHHKYARHHDILLQNCFAQAQALMIGQYDNNANLIHIGNRPSNTIILDYINANCIGALLATYEHKIFTQGVFWHINSFDQWGVEFGKKLANQQLELAKRMQT
jgi:glucose-6-phosphate isomerase